MIYSNLSKAFPIKNKTEIDLIAKNSFRNFCDTIVESLKLFSISEKQLLKRLDGSDIKWYNYYYQQQRPLIAISGHFGNWEYTGIMGLRLKQQIIALYKPLKDKFLDQQIKQSRANFGAILWSNKQTQALFEAKFNKLPMYVFIGDQSPSNPSKAYWTDFLGIETAFFRGAAKASLKYNYPIVTFYVKRIKRGYYRLETGNLVEEPAKFTEDELCEIMARAYEKMVLKEPANWLWTHKRWKRKRPENLMEEKDSFNVTT